MSPRKRAADIEVQDPEAEETIPGLDLPTPEEMEDAQRLGDFQARFGGKDYKVRVDRYNKEDAEWEYATSCKLDGFDPFITLQKTHGGGKYRLTLLDDGGRYVKGGRQEIRIAESAVKPEAEAPKPSPWQDPGILAVMEMLKAQSSQATEMVKAMIAAQSTKPAEQPIAELVGALAKLQGMVPREADSMKGVKDALEMLTAAKVLLPEAKEATEGGGMLSEVLEAVKAGKELGFFDRHRQQPSLPAPGRIASPVAAPIICNPPEAVMSKPDPIMEKVNGYLPILTAWAKRGEEVADAADFVVTEVVNEIVPVIVENYRPGGLRLNAETILSHLIEKAKDPAEVEKIYAFAPGLMAYRPWVEAVVSEAVRIIEAPSEPEPPADLAPEEVNPVG